jgi:hypothetical protein
VSAVDLAVHAGAMALCWLLAVFFFAFCLATNDESDRGAEQTIFLFVVGALAVMFSIVQWFI